MNLYDVLGISSDVSQEEVKKAYQKLAKKHHPDKGGDHDLFVDIQKAYDVLGNPESREEYDSYGNGYLSDGLIKQAKLELTGIFNKVLDAPDGVNIITAVKDIAKGIHSQINFNKQKTIAAAKKLRKITKKIRNKKRQRFLESILEGHRRSNIAQYRELKKQLQVYDIILLIIDGYDYKMESYAKFNHNVSVTSWTV